MLRHVLVEVHLFSLWSEVISENTALTLFLFVGEFVRKCYHVNNTLASSFVMKYSFFFLALISCVVLLYGLFWIYYYRGCVLLVQMVLRNCVDVNLRVLSCLAGNWETLITLILSVIEFVRNWNLVIFILATLLVVLRGKDKTLMAYICVWRSAKSCWIVAVILVSCSVIWVSAIRLIYVYLFFFVYFWHDYFSVQWKCLTLLHVSVVKLHCSLLNCVEQSHLNVGNLVRG